MAKSRFFRVAVEGATTDGRQIDRKWLEDMAATYNPATYAARVNMEHIRGATATGPFSSLGDVVGLKTETIDLEIGGKTEQRLALYAQVDALDTLVEINRSKQKLYSSVEVNPNFAGSGKAYLVGLAVTDSPASLGTEMLQFCAAQGDKSPLAGRKQEPDNLFTAATEFDLEIEGATAADPAGSETFFSKLSAIVDKLTAGQAPVEQPAPPADPAPAPAAPAADNGLAELATQVGGLAAMFQTTIGELRTANETAQAEIAALSAKFDKLPDPTFNARPKATGGNGSAKTDC